MKNTREKTPQLLIVDDIKINRDILKCVFDNNSIIIEAANGEEALKILEDKANEIDAVLLDIMMPVLDGFQVLAKMRKNEKLAEIPVLVITGLDDEQSQIKALDLGAVDVIGKPFNPKIVKARTDNAIIRRYAQINQKESELLQYKLEAQQLSLEKSRYDSLTGLYSKQYFFEEVARELKENPKNTFVIAQFDLDKFKIFNDAFGTNAGDKLLEFIGTKIIRNKIGVLSSRLQSDHFAVLLNEKECDYKAFLDEVQSWFLGYPLKFNFSVKVGYYKITEKDIDVSVMCDRALLAQHCVKNIAGPKYGEYDDSLRQILIDEENLISEMNDGFLNEEYEVWYQPQYDYSSGFMCGAEALVRWNHPRLGLISPSKFIPIMEKKGIIARLDEYVWEQCCKDIRSWLDQNKEGATLPPISTNISRTDLLRTDLASVFERLTEKYNIPHNLLNLEITESAYIEDSKQLLKSVNELKDLGFIIEMDDFGAGYSSLNTLKDVPVDILKLDMNFLKGTQDSPRSGSILNSIIRMSHWLSIPVIAEGIETQEQADYLKSIGCHLMQGFLFSKPIHKNEFEKLYLAGTKLNKQNLKKSDMKDIEPFWSVANQTALIFNSYLGGAAIIECCNDNIELLRANDKFFEILHTNRSDYMVWTTHLQNRFDSDNQLKLYKKCLEAEISEQEVAVELLSKPLNNNEEIWTQSRIKMLAKSGDSLIFYIGIENITEKKKAIEELQKDSALLHSLYDTITNGVVRIKLREKGMELASCNNLAVKLLNFNSKEDMFVAVNNNDISANIYEFDKEIFNSKISDIISLYKKSTGFEYRIKDQNENIRYIYVDIQKIITENEQIFLQIILSDITEQKLEATKKYGNSLLVYFKEIFDVNFNNMRIKQISECDDRNFQSSGDNLDEILKGRLEQVVFKKDKKRLIDRFLYIQKNHPKNVSDLPRLDYKVRLSDGTLGWRTLVLVYVDDGRYICCITDTRKKI